MGAEMKDCDRDKIKIGPFNTSADLLLRRAENGGYIVEEIAERSLVPKILGAYSTPRDMIDALASALCPRENSADATTDCIKSLGFVGGDPPP